MLYQNYGKQKQLEGRFFFLKHIHMWGEKERMNSYIYTYGKVKSNLNTWVLNYQKIMKEDNPEETIFLPHEI